MSTPEQRAQRAAYMKAWRMTQSPEKRSQVEAAAQNRRKAAHLAMTDELKAVGCAWCGGPGTDFHHVDPSTKSFGISYGFHHSKAAVEAELAKCIVLCTSCHGKHHSDQRWAAS